MGRAIFPELHLLHSVTSGQPRFGGQLPYYKNEGLETGYPDLHLPVSRGGFGSLWIELKAPGGTPKPRPDQVDRIVQLTQFGCLVFVLNDYDAVLAVLQEYCLGYYVRR